MDITELLFLFLFLPVSLVLYYGSGTRLRKYILLIVSLLFYACGSLNYFLLLFLSIFINIIVALVISRFSFDDSRHQFYARCLFIAGILYNIGILFYYKYFDFFTVNINRMFGTEIEVRNSILPLGLSFFTFKAISYLADVYQKKIKVNNNPLYAALYFSFFGQVQSGPLTRYHEFYRVEKANEGAFKNVINHLSEGSYRFMIGFNKKILLANILAKITEETFSAASGDLSVSLAWLGSICYSLQIFFDFSGYSDMAIGISRMFGLRCSENFNYPYMSGSVSEFWRRWHMTLGTWFRDYVYIPLGGSRVKRKSRIFVNVFIVWLLTGIWHGANWSFVIWGLLYFILISFEKATGWPAKCNTKYGKLIYRVFSILFINFQFVIFRADSVEKGFNYIKNMFWCGRNTLADARALFLLKDNFVFILAAVILCFPIIPFLKSRFQKRKSAQAIWNLAYVFGTMLLFIVALSFVVAGQNNPFAYANF